MSSVAESERVSQGKQALLCTRLAFLLLGFFGCTCVVLHFLPAADGSLTREEVSSRFFDFLSVFAVGRFAPLMNLAFLAFAGCAFFTAKAFSLEAQGRRDTRICVRLFVACGINVLVVLLFPLRGEFSTWVHNLAVPPLFLELTAAFLFVPVRFRSALPLRTLPRLLGAMFFFLLVSLGMLFWVGVSFNGLTQRLLVSLFFIGQIVTLLRLRLRVHQETEADPLVRLWTG